MAYFDIFTLVIVILCALIGTWGGFTQNVLKILSFIAAIIIGCHDYRILIPFLSPYLHLAPGLLAVFSGILTGLLTLILGFLFTSLIGRLVKATPLASLDRILGLLLGALIGIAGALGGLLAAHWLLEPDVYAQLTRGSRFLPYFIEIYHNLLAWWSPSRVEHA